MKGLGQIHSTAVVSPTGQRYIREWTAWREYKNETGLNSLGQAEIKAHINILITNIHKMLNIYSM